MREINFALPISPQIVLAGNIHDIHPIPDEGRTTFKPTMNALVDLARMNGYDAVLRYDVVDGLAIEYEDEGRRAGTDLVARATDVIAHETGEGDEPSSLDVLRTVLTEITPTRAQRRRAEFGATPAVLVAIDYASRLRASPDSISDDIHALFAFSEKLAHDAIPLIRNAEMTLRLFNPIVWITDRSSDLPAWLAESGRARTVTVPRPPLAQRAAFAGQLISRVPGYLDLDEEARSVLDTRFAKLTDGMTYQAMTDVSTLALDLDITAAEIDRAVRSHRAGVSRDPWRAEGLGAALEAAETDLKQTIYGQDRAITQALEVLYRAHLGLNGSQSGDSHANRPKGVLFFAGPTGVGKTELAKQLAKIIFGTEQSLVRFDMSEYSSEASEARLVGAPPSYVGHEAGGQLTNAIRAQPFSILLFDEMEKAHESIPRKFLQMLEDGRLTDGHGNTVSFSDALIIFTSNLGTVDATGKALIDPSLGPDEVRERVHEAVVTYFNATLKMPELLNRIGTDNIVVFDFIRAPHDLRLLDIAITHVLDAVHQQHKADVSLSNAARDRLIEALPERLGLGGRGIANLVGARLVNPLSRALFDRKEPLADQRFELVSLDDLDGTWRATLEPR